MIERVAHAKVNLALHVTGQRPDGYHLLDSIVVFTEYGDCVRVEKSDRPSDHLQLAVEGPFANGLAADQNNLVMQAAQLLCEALAKVGERPENTNITLIKNLPVSSGIGGGSADAAAVLLALREFWKCRVDLLPIARELGADVPMCLRSAAVRARGIGDQLNLLSGAGQLAMVLVNPGVEVSTPEVFKRLDCKQNPPISRQEFTLVPGLAELGQMRNDLEPVAIRIFPEIADVLAALGDSGALLARMSGSGATCFGIYDCRESADTACDTISQQNPNWWCVSTRATDRVS